MNIKNFVSPNFTQGRKQYKPEAIVIHIMQGSLSGTDSWFATPQSSVSAHYGIGISGEVHAYVSETNTAWHAGRVNNPSWASIKKTANGLYINPNYYTIGIEHEGDENSEWTEDMYRTSADLIRDIASRWSIPIDREHVVGHHQIFSLKSCPGYKVDLNKLVLLAGGMLPTLPVQTTPTFARTGEKGKVITLTKLNLRSQPNTSLPPTNTVAANVVLDYEGFTNEGKSIKGNQKWYVTKEGNWFWSGGVSPQTEEAPPVHNASVNGDSLTVQQLKAGTGAISQQYAEKIHPYVKEAIEKFHISTLPRRLCFLAQVGHESGGLFYTEELASGKAYEGRKDLQNTEPGDGIRYKGRGLIQITGRVNYSALSKALGENFIGDPQLLGGKNIKVCTGQQLRYAALSAGWFWNEKNLNSLADQINMNEPLDEGQNLILFKQITRKINGGYNGLQDRIAKLISGVQQFTA